MFEIIPGILEKEWEKVAEKIERVLPFAKTIHIDILDGKFAPNTTFLDPEPFKKYSKDVFFELHMMVEDPMRYLQPFADAGFKRFLGHVEKMPDIAEFVAQAELLGEVGLAIDGKTPLDSLNVRYEDLDCLLFMTINAGFSGQQFMPENLEKVKHARKKIDHIESVEPSGKPFPIEVDGGVNDETIVKAKDAGVTRFITTSFLFKGEPKKQYEKLQEKLGV